MDGKSHEVIPTFNPNIIFNLHILFHSFSGVLLTQKAISDCLRAPLESDSDLDVTSDSADGSDADAIEVLAGFDSSSSDTDQEAESTSNALVSFPSAQASSSSGTPSAASGSARRTFFKKTDVFTPVQHERVSHDSAGDSLAHGTGIHSLSTSATPLDCFKQFVPLETFELITNASNRSAVRVSGKSLLLKRDECVQFFGATLLMSVMKLPWIRLYWARETRVAAVADVFTRSRFHQVRSRIKIVVDEEVPQDSRQQDRLWKVRPLLETIRQGCLKMERPVEVSIDEQMIPFTGKTGLKQFVPGKPNPEGLKNFVLASSDGMVLDFEVYQGKKLADGGGANGKPWLVGESVVVRLTESLPQGTSVFFDRFFTTPRILEHLQSKRLHGTGTVKKIYVPKEAGLMTEKQLLKQERGFAECSVRSDSIIALTVWQDKRAIYLASTEHGIEPQDEVSRYEKKTRSYRTVSRPAVVKAYNACMGGVDLNDRMIALYRAGAKSKKWTIKTILHFIDMAAVNAWILHRRSHGEHRMKFLEFKYALAKQMLSWCDISDGSESSSESEEQGGKPPKRARVPPLPSPRLVATGKHLPRAHVRKEFRRCRNAGCSMKTGTECRTCGIFLCCRPERDCFYEFHVSKRS